MTTAGDQINRALRLIGVLAEGETPSADTSADALVALNQMIDSWNTERLSVFSTIDQTVTWPSSQMTQTLGPSGSLALVGGGTPIRPIQIDDSTYYKDPGSGVSYGISIVNQEQYDSIALKTATSTFPQILFINTSHPDLEMAVYPVPTRDLEWHIISVQELSQISDLSTAMVFPPGYLRAFTYNLALEIAPEFGVEPSPQVSRIAMSSKRNLKRVNNQDDVLQIPLGLTKGQRYNIFAGNY